ncbi:MAG: hypothetical protein HY438_02300 [DPANN group archaeon]|nr:hypothetical protein [DPANN group archaeon]
MLERKVAPKNAKIKRVAVDVDGVLAKFHDRFLHLLNKDFGTHYTLDDIASWDIGEALPVMKKIKEVFGEQVPENVCWRYFDLAWLNPEKMEPLPGAVNAMKNLYLRQDLQLDIVTSRRINSGRDMLTWIDFMGIPFHGIVVLDAFGKHSDKSMRGYDVLIDDSPRLARKMAGHLKSTLLLFPANHNKGVYTPNVLRMTHGWKSVREYFNSIK